MKFLPMGNVRGQRVSDNIPIDKTQTWLTGKEYKENERVKYAGVIYESKSAKNRGNSPQINTVKWQKVGVVNELAYLDGLINNQSVSSKEIRIKYNLYATTDLIAVGGLCGEKARFIVRNAGGGIVLDETLNMQPPLVEMSWWWWSFPTLRTATFENSWTKKITPATGQTIEVIVTPFAGRACIGLLAFNALIDMGCTLSRMERVIRGSIRVEKLRDNVTNAKDRRGYIKFKALVAMKDETTGDSTLKQIDKLQLELEKYVNVPIGIFADDTGESYTLKVYGVYDTIRTAIDATADYEIIIDSLNDILS